VQLNKRVALGAAAIAAVAISVPASAGQGGTHGNGSAPCVNMTTGQQDGTVTWTPTSVWPPNHKMQTVTISYTAPSDVPGDQSTITIGMITDDQAAADGSDELNGSGQPTDQQGLDWAGTGNTASADEGSPATTTAQVRAERSGHDQTGRTYTIQVMCGENDGGTGAMEPTEQGTANVTVTVPHDQGQN
jgi:hypothetical protein